jgi:xanthine/uracil permease
MGVTFAAVGPLVAMAASGIDITGIFGAVIVAGVFTVLVAPFASRLVRYFPPLVTGTIITVIGITLLRIGINWAGGGVGAKNFGDPINLGLVALVLATILVTTSFHRLRRQHRRLLGRPGLRRRWRWHVDFAGVYDARGRGWLTFPARTPGASTGAIASPS